MVDHAALERAAFSALYMVACSLESALIDQDPGSEALIVLQQWRDMDNARQELCDMDNVEPRDAFDFNVKAA